MQRTPTRFRPLLLVLGALAVPFLLAAPTFGAPAPSTSLDAFASPAFTPLSPFVPLWATGAPAQAGLLAFYDPETGTAGGPRSAHDLGTIAVNSDWQSGVVETRTWDGTPMVDVSGLMLDYSVMELTADGHLVLRCGPNPNTALKAVTAPVAKPVEE
jgi:hypothetical protein